jgi:hypothetical protein
LRKGLLGRNIAGDWKSSIGIGHSGVGACVGRVGVKGLLKETDAFANFRFSRFEEVITAVKIEPKRFAVHRRIFHDPLFVGT